MLVIFLVLLLLLLSMAVIGEPLRIAISRFSKLFVSLDLIQVLTIDVFFGGIILYIIALIPLHLVNPTVTVAMLLLSSLFTLGFYLRRFLRKELRSPGRNDILCYVVVMVVFLSTLLIELAPTTNFLFGSVNDTSLTALYTQVILENQQIPMTLQPYLPEGIVYPQAFFVVSAFTHIILNLSVAETPLLITPLFQAFAVLGAYYLGKVLMNRKLGVSLAFIFGFVGEWPKLVTWGSNAFVFGFSLYFISLGLIANLKNSQTQGVTWPDLFIIGMIYGYLAAIHLQLYVVVIASMFSTMLAYMLLHGRESVRLSLTCLVSVTLVSLIPLSPFILRAISWRQYPLDNIGVPTDVIMQPYTMDYSKTFTLITGAFGNYLVTAIEVCVLFGVGIAILVRQYRRRKLTSTSRAIGIIGASLLGCLVCLFISLLQFAFPLFALFIGEPGRYVILLDVGIFLFLGILFVLFHDYLQSSFGRQTKPARRYIRTIRGYLPVLLVFATITAPFICYSVAYDPQYLTGNYAAFAVAKQGDLVVMQWMKGNLPSNSSILVNPDDAGSFIPAVSNLRVVYPFTASRSSKTYMTVVVLISKNIFNSTTYDLIKDLNVSHIFFGSASVAGSQFMWNPFSLIGNSHFELIEQSGDCYLFKVTY